MTLKERAKQLKIDIPAIFLVLKHERTPWYAKAMAGVTIGYALSPVDLIPDFIPVLGYLDDVIILPFLIVLTIKLIPADLFEECREKSRNMWKDGKPKKWYYAVPIIIIWLTVIVLILKRVVF